MANYYNEYDHKAAEWLRALIQADKLPQGHVDHRSITDVRPEDLQGYTQCHFFAGIGGWSLALQYAGWSSDRPVWTGSCPCQPFSVAGKQQAQADERHLWPVWFNLIRECRPTVVFGEQVSGAITHGWLDEVSNDMEAECYAIGSAVLPACSVGAPHKRDRLWFVADSRCSLRQVTGSDRTSVQHNTQGKNSPSQFKGDGQSSNVANTKGVYAQGCENGQGEGEHWGNSAWINCPDGKQRLIEPTIPLLANGVPARVVKLRALGNAIVPQVAAEFVKAYIDIADNSPYND